VRLLKDRGATAAGASQPTFDAAGPTARPAKRGRARRRDPGRRLWPRVAARLSQENGFVMVIALIVVAVVLLLAAALISSSVTTSTHATKEYERSSALSAANAGLAAAIHRLSSQPQESEAQMKMCFTTTFVEAKSGACGGTEEALANGAHYKYYVYPALTENTCTGLWVEVAAPRSLSQRCVTSIGTATNGVKARVQERIAAIRGGYFTVKGVFSLSEFLVNNKLIYNGELGALNNVTFNNPVEANPTIAVKYGNTMTGENKCSSGCTYSKLTAEELASERYKLPEPSAVPYAEAQLKNNNAKVTFTTGSINANRELTAGGAGTIKFPSGTYDLCYIGLNNPMTIEYTPPVTIYLDSAYRSGSTCPAGNTSGTINFNNEIKWVDLASSKTPSDLRIEAWGKPKETNGSAPPIKLNNNVNGSWYAEIYAPYSFVEVNNKLQMTGAIEAGDIKFNNEVEMTGATGTGEEWLMGTSFYATAYHECSPSYTASTPAVGCY
jgi:Tfp pilus assembly protein PilX